MPLHDVGYRPWQGERLGSSSAIGVIALTGIRLAWTSRWLRRMVFFAWSPALVFATSFFAFEQAIDEGRLANMRDAARAGRNLDGVGMLGTVLADTLGRSPGTAAGTRSVRRDDGPILDPKVDIADTRRLVWSRLLLAFMRVPQAVLLAVVIGLVAPTLVSRDLRAKAWLVYFTRPVGRLEYILGKAAILGVLVAAITVLPALALWLMGVLVSPSVWVAVDTWDLPIKAVAASVVLAVPTVLLALAYSAATAESRIASFAWFATWAACWIAHSTLTTADLVAAVRQAETADAAGGGQRAGRAGSWSEDPFGDLEEDRSGKERRSSAVARTSSGGLQGRFRWLAKAAGMDPAIDRWAWLSPYHALGVVQAWIFGTETRPQAVLPSLVSLTLVSLIAVIVLLNRIDAPTRV
jgi:ABC-type transport system involved in multi-copper enzyme maturation permease subunit